MPDSHAIFAHALRAEAEFERVRGNHASSERAQREAVARLEAGGATSVLVAIARMELAGSLSRRGESDGARELLEEALPVLRESLLPAEIKRAEAEILARELGLRERLSQSD